MDKGITAIDHGQIYRFMNLVDNRFLDLTMRSTENGSKLVVWDGNTSNAQRFRAEVVEGGFRLLSQCRKKGEPLRLVTESPDGNGLVIYADNAGVANQLWRLAEVSEDNAVVLILNNGTGKALAHQGVKEQVRCINVDPNDVHQQWKLIIAEHSQPGHND